MRFCTFHGVSVKYKKRFMIDQIEKVMLVQFYTITYLEYNYY